MIRDDSANSKFHANHCKLSRETKSPIDQLPRYQSFLKLVPKRKRVPSSRLPSNELERRNRASKFPVAIAKEPEGHAFNSPFIHQAKGVKGAQERRKLSAFRAIGRDAAEHERATLGLRAA